MPPRATATNRKPVSRWRKTAAQVTRRAVLTVSVAMKYLEQIQTSLPPPSRSARASASMSGWSGQSEND